MNPSFMASPPRLLETIRDYEKVNNPQKSKQSSEEIADQFIKENSGLMSDLAKLKEEEKASRPFWDEDVKKPVTFQERIEKFFSSWIWPWKK